MVVLEEPSQPSGRSGRAVSTKGADQVGQLSRERRLEGHDRSGRWLRQGQANGVKEWARQARQEAQTCGRGAARAVIERITDHGMPGFAQMDPNLVGPPSTQVHLDERDTAERLDIDNPG